MTLDVDRMASLDINVLIAKLVLLGAGEKKLYLSVGFYKTCIDPPRSAAKNDSINYYVGFYLGCVLKRQSCYIGGTFRLGIYLERLWTLAIEQGGGGAWDHSEDI